jgi:hypothetical protein
MIAPEDVQRGDLLGIYSPDGGIYRGQVFVRELINTENGRMIAFNTSLPPGTTQGDILCLIRRRDEIRILQSIELDGVPADRDLYVPSQYTRQIRDENDRLLTEAASLASSFHRANSEINRLRNRCTVLESELAAAAMNTATVYRSTYVPAPQGPQRRIKSSSGK